MSRGTSLRVAKVAKVGRLLLALGALVVASACTAIVGSSPLSPRPHISNQMFLSTGGTTRPYTTIGFVQATGFGNQVAGVIDVGDAQIDSTVRGALAQAAAKMGGHGVINIEFEDENPQTPADRMQDLAESAQQVGRRGGEVKTRWRSVHATGEVIKFTP